MFRHRIVEHRLDPRCWAGHVLAVDEDAVRRQQMVNLLVQFALPFVGQVMDREPRDHGIERPLDHGQPGS